MYSYEERLASFHLWPATLKHTLTKKLAVLGQYSTDDSSELTTACIYCNKKMDGWKEDDIPFIEHLKHNDNCMLFSLDWALPRRLLAHQTATRGGIHFDALRAIDWAGKKRHGSMGILTPEEHAMAKRAFIRLDVRKNTPLWFCSRCGSGATDHNCSRISDRREHLTPASGHARPLFYIKWLRGDYLDMIDKYSSSEIRLSEDKKEMVRCMLEAGKPLHVMESINDVVERSIDVLLREFDEEIDRIEKEAPEIIKINNE